MSLLRIAARKAINFFRLPLFSQLGFIPVYLLLGLAKLAIFTISFRRLAPVLGLTRPPAVWVPLISPAQEARARAISRLVTMTARYTPWESNCFPQAVAVRCLLGAFGIPYAMFFGLMRESGSQELKAHAWVAAGRVRVSGGESFSQYTAVGCFISPLLAELPL